MHPLESKDIIWIKDRTWIHVHVEVTVQDEERFRAEEAGFVSVRGKSEQSSMFNVQWKSGMC